MAEKPLHLLERITSICRYPSIEPAGKRSVTDTVLNEHRQHVNGKGVAELVRADVDIPHNPKDRHRLEREAKMTSHEFGCTTAGMPTSESHNAAGSLGVPSLSQTIIRQRSSGSSRSRAISPPSSSRSRAACRSR